MENMVSYDAIVFPADERAPHLIPLMWSNASSYSPVGQSSQPSQPVSTKIPHPEMYMDFIAEGVGPVAWRSHVVEMLDGMNKKFANPYIIYYAVLSRDGMPFPINKCVKEIQGSQYREGFAWRGNLVIAKFRDEGALTPMDATMADFPLLKNYLATHSSPVPPPGT